VSLQVQNFCSPLINTVTFCECQKIKWEIVNVVSILGDIACAITTTWNCNF